MGQVKKEAVRTRILDAASKSFEEKGYVGATMGQIAERARLSIANIYVYFPSKLDIAFAIFRPWMAARIAQTEQEARAIRDPRRRLRHILSRLWRDIPSERNSYFNNFIQAIAVSTVGDGYTPAILLDMRERIQVLIVDCLPEARRRAVDSSSIAHLTVMAFDGFVINRHLDQRSACTDDLIDSIATLLFGDSHPARATAKRTAAAKSRRKKTPA